MLTMEEFKTILRERMRTGVGEQFRASRLGTNSNRKRVTDASWWYQGEDLALTPGTVNGGTYANKSGYHSSREENQAHWPGNYSYRHAEDLRGPADKMAGYDKTYPDAQAGRYSTIAKDCKVLELANVRRDFRLAGWVEYYGQVDTDTAVEGGNFRSGDTTLTASKTHLWHEHDSESREFVNSWLNKRAMLSIKRGQSQQEFLEEEGLLNMATLDEVNTKVTRILEATGAPGRSGMYNHIPGPVMSGVEQLQADTKALKAELDALQATVALLTSGVGTPTGGSAVITTEAITLIARAVVVQLLDLRLEPTDPQG